MKNPFRHPLSAVLLAALAIPAAAAERPTDLTTMSQFVEVMKGYFDVIERIHGVAADADKAAIQQLQKIDEIYKNRGERAESIKVLQKVVDGSGSATVRNAAVIMLADALNETGRGEQALAALERAMERNLAGSR
jgi:tetratricopeptide (TPR) repeat protein